MTQRQKSRFRMLCRELAKLVKEVRKEGDPHAFCSLSGPVLEIWGRLGPLEAERINPER